MKKFITAISMMLFAVAAHAQLAYPGSTWSEITVNPSVIKSTPEENNVLLQGAIQQGIVWTRVGDFKLNTFVGLNYSYDKNGLSYNNKLVPHIGIKLSHDYPSGTLDIGIRALHQNNFRGVTEGPKSGNGVQAFVGYWFGWDLKH